MSAANVAFWGILGAAMGAYDGYKYAKKKKLSGWKKAAAIVGGAALGAVNPCKVAKAAKKVYKFAKSARKAYKAAKLKKKAKAVARLTKIKVKKAVKKTVAKVKPKVQKAACKARKLVGKNGCFVAGTKVLTKDGFKNIEAIKVGDYVWSQDPATSEKALKSVKKIFVREKDSIIRLAINGEVVETTEEHPFYVEGRGFINAGNLKAGDEVRLESGEEAYIEWIEEVPLDEPIRVYNFEVEDFHTYYVSELGVLVHNSCKDEKEFSEWLNKGEADNTVYYGMEDGKATYVGITKQDLEVRRKQHNSPSNKYQKNFEELIGQHSNLTRNQARAIEQYYIEMKNGPNKLNIRNSVSPNNRFYKQAKAWAKSYLEEQ